MNGKPALKSKMIRFSLAMASVSTLTILSYILDVITKDGFVSNLMDLLAALGIDANTALVTSIVSLITAAINIALRLVTKEEITSLK